MGVLEINMRRPPPCRRCDSTGMIDFVPLEAGIRYTCPRCEGRSAHVEYTFIFWPSGAASFGPWPQPQS